IAVAIVLNLISFGVFTLGSLALTFMLPAIILATDTGGIGAGLRIGDVLRRARVNPINTLIAGLMLIAASFVGSLGLIACGGGFVPPPPAGYTPGAMAYAGTRNDGLAIASLICGIVGLVCFCLGVILGPAAAIMGFISRQRIAVSGGMLGGGGLALAGLILGIADFVVSAVVYIIYFYAVAHSGP